jgi:putative phosphoesterase
MRVAALYDIHGNLPALEAVLDEVTLAGVDRVVIGGDIVAGPMTREALQCLASFRTPVDFIQGDAEVAVLAAMTGAAQTHGFSESVQESLRWEAHQLRDYRSVMARWPMTAFHRIPGVGAILFCHGTPRDENEIFLRSTPDAVLEPIFAGIDADVVVCGHTHMQFDRRVGRVRVVNAGSIGMPFGAPGADWLLLGPEVELRHTHFDLDEAADRIRMSAYPQAVHFAEHHVLHPPTEAGMLEVFSRVALK